MIEKFMEKLANFLVYVIAMIFTISIICTFLAWIGGIAMFAIKIFKG